MSSNGKFTQPAEHEAQCSCECSVMNVLIVDDDRASREGLRELFELRPNITVIGEAINGEEAVNLADALHPDFVVMDVQMPKMDGLEATRQIKRQSPDIRIILLTMYREYRAAALRSGADAFLIKGEGIGQLLAALAG
ncbi:MAG: response regulator transcription factor [Thermomicrobia bacterium]|nr:response regulator transcription factor [Thermomicrobia bacterium]MCA1724088.1 response regulator transcription factor [Thermomicrobia bacterium]